MKTSAGKCDKQCGAVMHMTGGRHRTDCAAYEPDTLTDAQLRELLATPRITIIAATRPESNEEELAWICMIRNALGDRQSLFDCGEFVECDSCAAKPGSPSLCAGCLANRYVIHTLRKLAGRIEEGSP